MNNIKYGTHNSVTGEKAKGWCKIISLFARCQKMTIDEQLQKGITYFDIRIKKHKGAFVLCHGIWIANVTVKAIFYLINWYAYYNKIYVSITLEHGKYTDEIDKYIVDIMNKYNNIIYTTINVKKPSWKVIKTITNVPINPCYINLDGSTWHTLIPIPILWSKLHKYVLSKDYHNIIDFYNG